MPRLKTILYHGPSAVLVCLICQFGFTGVLAEWELYVLVVSLVLFCLSEFTTLFERR